MTGYRPGGDMVPALDCAATEFFKDGTYRYEGEGWYESHSPGPNI